MSGCSVLSFISCCTEKLAIVSSGTSLGVNEQLQACSPCMHTCTIRSKAFDFWFICDTYCKSPVKVSQSTIGIVICNLFSGWPKLCFCSAHELGHHMSVVYELYTLEVESLFSRVDWCRCLSPEIYSTPTTVATKTIGTRA